MIEVDHPRELAAYAGKSLGLSAWLTVDQAMITAFADATGDHQWIHVDTARAASEMPDGKTIAHGYLVLSLLPRMSADIYRIRGGTRSLNYGLNRLRFVSPVQVGARIRLDQTIKAVEPAKGGTLVSSVATIEIEGRDRPAVIAEPISLVFDG